MKKSRKSKIVLFSVLGLATVSLATVGFASWVISGVTPATSDNITAEVGKIEDKTLSATITSTTEDLSVRFDNVKKGTTNAKFDNGDGKVDGFETYVGLQMMAGSRQEAIALTGDDAFYTGSDSLEEDEDELTDELEMAGLDVDELEYMDEDERRESLEDAGLDPDDYDEF